ncbi:MULTISPECIES: hypothetical protein [Bradyrhizobium]|jgi:hypothetical protein|uniref:hypothetical protein n=1 Tax=Bradyrhizobium TaxID=374 RepID=UPI0004B3585F|nr:MULTISPECIES: hypothetical protein [Bradyrhizobium]MDI2110457.1 hypothetical protein [Bradyrhizobium sp. Mp64]WLB04493.1 hypothetical protein QNJ80_21875 [Bradyrhizobium elkanii]
MKVSADRGRPDYWPLHFTGKAPTVFLDGREIRNVRYADDQLGLVEVYQFTKSDAAMVCACGEFAMSRLLFGEVVILGRRRA